MELFKHMPKRARRAVYSALGPILCLAVLSACSQGAVPAKKQSEPISRSEFLLNTFVTITLYDTENTSILDDCITICKDCEAIFSKTLETSELYRINHRTEQTLTVSDDMAALLARGLYYCERSDGAFDITIEPLSSLWDFTAENPELPDASEIAGLLPRVGYQNLKLEENTLTFLSPDTTIDLGAIAKGYIADKIKSYLKTKNVASAIINLGGNVLCVGTRPDGTPFHIGLQMPFAERNETIEVMGIDDLSVVSSGVYERHFIVDGVNYHHILDPSTGYPYDNGLISVTILSESSTDGDGLSTTCFSLGLEKGMELADSIDGVYACFIDQDYNIYYSEGAEDFILQE